MKKRRLGLNGKHTSNERERKRSNGKESVRESVSVSEQRSEQGSGRDSKKENENEWITRALEAINGETGAEARAERAVLMIPEADAHKCYMFDDTTRPEVAVYAPGGRV